MPAAEKMPVDDYVLITAAHDEEAFIEGTIRSVLCQRTRPLRWVIVSDASVDRTDEIASKFARENPFIEFVRLDAGHRHDFGAKVHALRVGYEKCSNLSFAFIGILDADVSFGPDYYSSLIETLEQEPSLGITGGSICESQGDAFTSRKGNRTYSVAGATQFFKRDCFESIGGITPLRYGGEDWCAEVCARMIGWTVRSNPGLRMLHHRPTGSAGGDRSSPLS